MHKLEQKNKKIKFLSHSKYILRNSLTSFFLFLFNISEWVSINSVNTAVQLKYSCTSTSKVPPSILVTGCKSHLFLLSLRKRPYLVMILITLIIIFSIIILMRV